jgi:AcrR family transcriptional regulator
MGLRDRKKEQTRRRIADTAHRLFGEHGFEKVTVAQVARAAEVAEATLFNYFPTKEDLFYAGLEAFGSGLVDAVRQRPAGIPAVAAVRSYLLTPGGQLARIAAGDPEALEQARTTARLIASSPALRARERRVFAEIAEELAGVLADPAESTLVTRAIANALVGVHIALVEHVRHRLLTDAASGEIGASVRAEGERVFALLERGLADFARAPTLD